MYDALQKVNFNFLGKTRKSRLISISALLLASVAIGAAAVVPGVPPKSSEIEIRSISEEIKVPALEEQITLLNQEKYYFMREEKTRIGDTLNLLLSRLGINDTEAVNFIKNDPITKKLLSLKTGKIVQAKTDNYGKLYWLYISTEKGDQPYDIVISRNEKGFSSSNDRTAIERRIEMRSGVIRSSLFSAADLAGIPDIITNKMVDMFATNINFASDVQQGDRFNVIYESYYRHGTFLRSGRILAAEFINGNNAHQVVWFEGLGNRAGGYYSFDGKPQRKAFLKYPLAFTRVSSSFAMRKHPITGLWKHHKGIDYAAPTGTPIRATADGIVDFAGWQSGYGNYIVLKHWGAYTTAYGHMSRFNRSLTKGSKVKQGDVIGYVGSTGLSTGPHLHYEFRINNVQHDPKQVEMPDIQPLTVSEMEKFRILVADMRHRFSLMNPSGTSYNNLAIR